MPGATDRVFHWSVANLSFSFRPRLFTLALWEETSGLYLVLSSLDSLIGHSDGQQSGENRSFSSMHCTTNMVSQMLSFSSFVLFSWLVHLKYSSLTQPKGQYVRICPDQVSISDMQSVKEIHKIGTGFLKTKFYQQLTHEAPDCLTSFTLRDPKQHSQRRKLLASPMSKNGLLQWEDLIHEKVNMAIEGIKRTANVEGKANILAWFTFLVSH